MDNAYNTIISSILGIDPEKVTDKSPLCTEINNIITNFPFRPAELGKAANLHELYGHGRFSNMHVGGSFRMDENSRPMAAAAAGVEGSIDGAGRILSLYAHFV